jgi:hypothetical protein
MSASSETSRYANGFDISLRGDTITPDRYICKEFMARENEHLWPKIWHLGIGDHDSPSR